MISAVCSLEPKVHWVLIFLRSLYVCFRLLVMISAVCSLEPKVHWVLIFLPSLRADVTVFFYGSQDKLQGWLQI
jgi:hypothetical protein